MSGVHHGEAIRERRILASHRVALDVLRLVVLERFPEGAVTWLDVGCGRGQILYGTKGVVGEQEVARIRYFGCDGDRNYCREATEFATQQGFVEPQIVPCGIDQLRAQLGHVQAQFVTIANVVHELEPSLLAATIFDGLACLSGNGVLHVHDIRSVDPAELGSVCWTADEIEVVLAPLLSLFKRPGAQRRVQEWGLEEARDWCLDLWRDRLPLTDDQLAAQRDETVGQVEEAIRTVLPAKRNAHHRALKTYLQYPPQTDESRREVSQAVHECWTISAWLEGVQ